MKKKILPYLLLAPMILIMGALVIYPILMTFSYSLKRWKLTAPDEVAWIGWENYKEVLGSESFWYSFTNTIVILVIVVILTTLFGLLVSMLLSVESKLSGVLLAAAILPWALPPYVNGILWRFIFYPGYGLMNKLCILFHITQEPVEWLLSRWTLLAVVSFVAAWRSIPFTALVCLAGRKAISPQLYEAGRIDGGNGRTLFTGITFPLLLPFLGIGVTHASIAAVNVFDEIVALSGYSDLGKNLLMESYLTTFSFLDFGKGSAITYLIMAFSGVLAYFYLRVMGKEVEY